MGLKEVLTCFPDELSAICAAYPETEEIRLSAGKPVLLYCDAENVLKYKLSGAELAEIASALAGHSLFSHEDELCEGFFTASEGTRVGVAGRIVTENGRVARICGISSLVIRFGKDIHGISDAVLKRIMRPQLMNTLIISDPGQGKTTLLRDMVRTLSNSGKRCVVIDERGELSGGGSFDLGLRTDVLLSCPRVEGLSMAVRTLNPDVIATDEIGGSAELEALVDASRCGVVIIATAHAGSVSELLKRRLFRELTPEVFRCVIELSNNLRRGTVKGIYINGENVLVEPFLLTGGD